MLTGLTLPEAMRKSREMAPRTCLGVYCDEYDSGAVCALGGALVAVEGAADIVQRMSQFAVAKKLLATFPVLGQPGPDDGFWTCPECQRTDADLSCIVGDHLNDEHEWSREEIAAWLEKEGIQ